MKKSLSEVSSELTDLASRVGMEKDENKRSGSFLHVDHKPLLSIVSELFKDELELLDIKEALRKHGWLKDYYGKLIPPSKDEYTSAAENRLHGGYFIRALPGAKINFPLQACLMISRKNFSQHIHNVIIAEEGSTLNVITGCVTHPLVGRALHVGVTEFYVKRGAKLNFTMIHSWGRGVLVRPRSAVLVEEDAAFISNYVCLNPVDDMQMYPAAYCVGKASVAQFNNILYAKEGSHMDVGSKVEMQAPESRGEIISRIVARDNSKVVSRGLIVGAAQGVKGHLECRGLLLDDKSEIYAIPELLGKKHDVDLYHEAAVGKIAEKEIIYLMSRGLTQEEAVSTIIRGFLDVEILELPEGLAGEIQKLINQLTRGI